MQLTSLGEAGITDGQQRVLASERLVTQQGMQRKCPLVLWGEDLPSRGMPGAAEATGLGEGGRVEWGGGCEGSGGGEQSGGRGAVWEKGGERSLRRLRGLELKSASDAPPCGSSEKGKEGM